MELPVLQLKLRHQLKGSTTRHEYCNTNNAVSSNRINYINSEKQLGHKETVVKELLGLDVSATTVDFKIAKLCLEDKNDMVYKLLKETYPSSYDAEEIREWPIFIGFRETEFYDRFAKEHADDFNLHIYAEEEKS